jgi:outer membrane protein OmpA-like peptidoglycan-associated protein/Tol biopolymer transport system component
VVVASLAGAGLTLASDAPTVTLVAGSPFGTGFSGDSPYGIAFSPDGQFIATSNLNGGTGANLGIFTVNSDGSLVPGVGAFLGGHGSIEPEQTMFSPNGKFVAVSETDAGSGDNQVAVFGVDSNGNLAAVSGSPFSTGRDPYGMAFSPNGDFLATANYLDGTVSVFSVASDGVLSQVSGSPFATTSSDTPYGLAFSPDGTELAVTLPSADDVEVFSVSAAGALTANGTPVSAGSGTVPHPVVWSPTGNLVATGNTGGSSSVSMFSVGSGGALTLLSGYPENVGSYADYLAFSPDGGLLAVDGPTQGSGPPYTNSIGVYAVGSGGGLTQLTGSPYLPGGEFGPDPLAFSPGGGLLAAAVTGTAQSEVSSFTVVPAAAPVQNTTTTPATTTPATTTTTPTTTTPPPNNVKGPTTSTTASPAPPAGGTAAPPGAVLPDKPLKVPPPVAEASVKGSTGLDYKLSSAGSKAAKGKRLIAYVWKLAGRVISHVADPSYKFAHPNRSYTVDLTVEETGGETGRASVEVHPIEVKAAPTPTHTHAPAHSHTVLSTSTTTLTLSSDTLFAWNSFTLTATAKGELSAARARIVKSPAVKVSGYCDNTGDNDPVSEGNTYNHWLSKMRALAVADYLYGDRVPKTVTLTGYGRTDFVATNATAVGRAENRRVVISFTTVTRHTVS